MRNLRFPKRAIYKCSTFFFRTVTNFVNECKLLPEYNGQFWRKRQKTPSKIQNKRKISHEILEFPFRIMDKYLPKHDSCLKTEEPRSSNSPPF
jgi:hypothetical protein